MKQTHDKPIARLISTAVTNAVSQRIITLCGVWIFCVWPGLSSAATYDLLPGQNVIGEVRYIETNHDDTLLEIAYEFGLGYEELRAANPEADAWKPVRGSRIILPLRFILPKQREGVHINIASYRLYYFPPEYNGKRVITYPVSVGRGEWPTPKKSTLIIDKLVEPTWYPPPEVRAEHEAWGDPLPRVVPPGEDNPLGKYALQLSLPGYFIHGTNKPYGIGMSVTHGCIRLRPNDIESLFDMVSRNTRVRITDEPYLWAIQSDVVYLEAHTGKSSQDPLQGSSQNPSQDPRLSDLTDSIRRMLKNDSGNIPSINWRRMSDVVDRAYGIPQIVSGEAPDTQPVKAKRAETLSGDLKQKKATRRLF